MTDELKPSKTTEPFNLSPVVETGVLVVIREIDERLKAWQAAKRLLLAAARDHQK